MTVLSRDDDHVLATSGVIVFSLFRRPYRAADIPVMEKLFDDQYVAHGGAGFAFIAVDTRAWSKAELTLLRDEPTRDGLARLQKKYSGGTHGQSAVVLLGSGIIVSMVRSLATGFSLLTGDTTRKYFSSADAGAAWLAREAKTDATALVREIGALAAWMVA
jgi:hypothetical protein